MIDPALREVFIVGWLLVMSIATPPPSTLPFARGNRICTSELTAPVAELRALSSSTFVKPVTPAAP